MIYHEDLATFDNSVFYIVRDSNSIIGSVKLTLWNPSIVLPIEKLFNINIEDIVKVRNGKIWHVGRFAVSKSTSYLTLKCLLTKVISQMCSYPNSIMVAECDKKFVKVLAMMGIRTEALGSAICYLGSLTLPIYSTDEWLSKFLYSENIGFHETDNYANECLNHSFNENLLKKFESHENFSYKFYSHEHNKELL